MPWAGPAFAQPLKGVCYGPAPLKRLGDTMPVDDFMSDAAKPLWSKQGRGDLALIKAMGADVMRMYGNDPNLTHTEFLDEAHSTGLKVIIGQSDWPFTQMQGNCLVTNQNCFSQVMASWLRNLQTGFLRADRTYHPGIHHVVVVNEPDLKLPGIKEPKSFCRAIISAIDGMLEAEKQAGVVGPLISYTVTFSFAICAECDWPDGVLQTPALGQMFELRKAFFTPSDYGYMPKNDLRQFFDTRFFNSVNTNNPSTELPGLLLDSYQANFPSTQIFFEEYHHPWTEQLPDLRNMLVLANTRPQIMGISFFEFQVRYDKGGEEMRFGMFGLGDFQVGTMDFGDGRPLDIWCLSPVADSRSSAGVAGGIPGAVTAAFGGRGANFDDLCSPDPATVPLTEQGFAAVRRTSSVPKMAVFLSRLVDRMGGEVKDAAELAGFAHATPSLEAAVRILEGQPSWATWDPYAACVADRTATGGSVGLAVEKACKTANGFNCAHIPAECTKNTWNSADYVLSVYYWNNANGPSKPMRDCYFNGAARFVRASLYGAGATGCVVTKDPQTTPLTDEGYQAIVTEADQHKVEGFVTRFAASKLGASIWDPDELSAFAQKPPSSLYDLERLLRGAAWVCSGETGRTCQGAGPGLTFVEGIWQSTSKKRDTLWWQKQAFVAVGSLLAVAVLGTCFYVAFPNSCRPQSWSCVRSACARHVEDGLTSGSDSEAGF